MQLLSCWDGSFTSEETNEILSSLASWHIAQVAASSPEREHITACVARDDYRSLCNTNFDYTRLAPLDAYHLRQVVAFFKKRSDLDFGIDKEAVAFSKFCASETLCSETNTLFRLWGSGKFQFDPFVERILHNSQRKITRILGDVPAFEQLHIRFGPGATTQVKKRDACAFIKLMAPFACSEDFISLLPEACEEIGGWFCRHEIDGADTIRDHVQIHEGELDFVLKDFETYRTIGKEPSLNMMFQLGLGDYMKGRLKKFGVDLSDQLHNQELARAGSITGALATLDLSSASDCVARELVAHLLPLPWFELLDRVRTGRYTYKDQSLKLQKFSSMGNGFTFPLESLIFFAIAESVCEDLLQRKPHRDELAVYGDDIIVPTVCFGTLVEVLRVVGFLPNVKKSFASGPFRESCGVDCFSGIDIRPAFIESNLDGPSIFVLHNFYVRRGMDEQAAHLRTYLHKSLQIFGPDAYGDGHLLGEWVARPHRRQGVEFPTKGGKPFIPHDWRSNRYSCGWSGYTFDTFTLLPRRVFRPLPGDCVLPSYSIYAAEGKPRLRDRSYSVPWQHRRDNRSSVSFWKQVERSDSSHAVYGKKGDLSITLPGSRGYKRISIYTLTPA